MSSNTKAKTAGETGFRPVGSYQASPLFRQRPRSTSSYLHFGLEGFECFLRKREVARMASWGQEAGDREIIGRLAGRKCVDAQGEYVLIERAILNRGAKGSAAFVVADVKSQEQLRRDLEEDGPWDSCGWWHTHPPRCALFFSGEDRENQATWTDPNSIGIVLNPHLEKEGLKLFRGPDCEELEPISSLAEIRGCRPEVRPVPSRPESDSAGIALEVPAQEATVEGERSAIATTPEKAMSSDPTFVLAVVGVCMGALALLLALMSFAILYAHLENGLSRQMRSRAPATSTTTAGAPVPTWTPDGAGWKGSSRPIAPSRALPRRTAREENKTLTLARGANFPASAPAVSESGGGENDTNEIPDVEQLDEGSKGDLSGNVRKEHVVDREGVMERSEKAR